MNFCHLTNLSTSDSNKTEVVRNQIGLLTHKWIELHLNYINYNFCLICKCSIQN